MDRQYTHVATRIGLACAAAAMLFPTQAPASAAHAAAIDLSALMARALGKVHSFRVVSDSRSTGAMTSPGGVMKMHMEEIFVRRGAGFTMSMQVTTDGQFHAMVYTGTHLCVKKTAAAAWDCTLSAAYVKMYTVGLDPVKAFEASGVVMTSVASAGTKTLQGQSCDGYRYAMALQSINLTGHGTIWFSSADGRVVQIDGVSTTKLTAASLPLVSTSTSTFSRWDDPSLRLPTVPAS